MRVSAFPPKTDIFGVEIDVRYVPKADIPFGSFLWLFPHPLYAHGAELEASLAQEAACVRRMI